MSDNDRLQAHAAEDAERGDVRATPARDAMARAMWEAPSTDDLLPWDELDEREREGERRLADAALAALPALGYVRVEDAIAVVEAERLVDDTGDPLDEAYNRALADAVDALRRLGEDNDQPCELNAAESQHVFVACRLPKGHTGRCAAWLGGGDKYGH